MSIALTDLPVELLTQILKNLDDAPNRRSRSCPALLNVSRTCKHLHSISQPIIYRNIRIFGRRAGRLRNVVQPLTQLLRSDDLRANCVRRLVSATKDLTHLHDIEALFELIHNVEQIRHRVMIWQLPLEQPGALFDNTRYIELLSNKQRLKHLRLTLEDSSAPEDGLDGDYEFWIPKELQILQPLHLDGLQHLTSLEIDCTALLGGHLEFRYFARQEQFPSTPPWIDNPFAHRVHRKTVAKDVAAHLPSTLQQLLILKVVHEYQLRTIFDLIQRLMRRRRNSDFAIKNAVFEIRDDEQDMEHRGETLTDDPPNFLETYDKLSDMAREFLARDSVRVARESGFRISRWINDADSALDDESEDESDDSSDYDSDDSDDHNDYGEVHYYHH